jgi:hypothetical protein
VASPTGAAKKGNPMTVTKVGTLSVIGRPGGSLLWLPAVAVIDWGSSRGITAYGLIQSHN